MPFKFDEESGQFCRLASELENSSDYYVFGGRLGTVGSTSSPAADRSPKIESQYKVFSLVREKVSCVEQKSI